MAKSLGQLHTVNKQLVVTSSQEQFDIDFSGELTQQLQRMIRQGQFYKLVGIDMSMTTVGTIGGGQVSGAIRYYAPTKGRCDAYKSAFKAMKSVMDFQGIKYQNNKLYDFRCAFNDDSSAFPNWSTLDGSNGLRLYSSADEKRSVFDVHNDTVTPTYEGTTGDLFDSGFDTIINEGASAIDFVLNDTVPYSGNHLFAETEWEYIPFTLSWTPDTTDLAVKFQWRPDPALYLAVMCGLMQVNVEELNLDGTPPAAGVEINCAFTIAGWKSIMGNPNKKRKGGKRGNKSRSRRRR